MASAFADKLPPSGPSVGGEKVASAPEIEPRVGLYCDVDDDVLGPMPQAARRRSALH